MKKILFTITLLLSLATITSAQLKVGGGLWYVSDIKSLGISANVNYDFTDNWTGCFDYTYVIKNNYVNMSIIDFDANYNNIFENVKVYPILGFSLTFLSVNEDIEVGPYYEEYASLKSTNYYDPDYPSGSYNIKYNETDFGVNMGIGYIVDLSSNLQLMPEIRYTVGGANYFRGGAKLMYVF